jgi:hypothetical protein
MIYALLFALALLFFISDHKIRFSAIAGSLVAIGSACGMAFVLFEYYTLASRMASYYSPVDTYRTNLNLALTNQILSLSLVSILAFWIAGRCLGKLIFKNAEDGDAANKKAKTLFIISSVLTVISGILFFVLNAVSPKLAANRPRIEATNLKYTIGLPSAGAEFVMGKYYVLFAAIIVLGIVSIILINTKITSYRELNEAGSEGKETKAFNVPLIIGLVLACISNIVALILTFSVNITIKEDICSFSFAVILALGLLFLLIGTKILASAKPGSSKTALQVISSVLAIASVVNIAAIARKLMRIIEGLLFNTDFILEQYFSPSSGFRRGQGGLLFRNFSVFLLVLLIAAITVTLVFLIKSSTRKKA